jgi:glycosyltransferase involved in cell wall biosynthesis
MKIVQVHNFYKIQGGEATVVGLEKDALEKEGHQIVPYYRNNDEIDQFSSIEKLRLIKQTTWSEKTYTTFREFLQKERPDICHVHNFLPLISPSIFQACYDENVPVVQTLHNYRLICTNGLLLREGKVCELCLGKSAYQAVAKKCYRNSAPQTWAVARMLEKNKTKKTWTEKVDAYLCLTEFAKSKFIAHGIPKEKLLVKPNMAPVPNQIEKTETEPYFIFVGRLTASKGVQLLKEIAPTIAIPIWLVGEGELQGELQGIKNLKILGKQAYQKTLSLIKNAEGLILPSLWYEGMPMTILEAFALKTPVLASNLGAMQSLIRPKENGLLFEPGSTQELIENLNFVLKNKDTMDQITQNAFRDYEEKFSVAPNVKLLTQIYAQVIAKKKA